MRQTRNRNRFHAQCSVEYPIETERPVSLMTSKHIHRAPGCFIGRTAAVKAHKRQTSIKIRSPLGWPKWVEAPTGCRSSDPPIKSRVTVILEPSELMPDEFRQGDLDVVRPVMFEGYDYTSGTRSRGYVRLGSNSGMSAINSYRYKWTQ